MIICQELKIRVKLSMNMNKNNCPVNELASFLVKRSDDGSVKISDNLNRHIELCSSCKELVQNPNLAKIFLKSRKFSLNIREHKDQVVLAKSVDFTQVKPGQIWTFKFSESNSEKFALVISEVGKDVDYVEIMPLYINPNDYNTSKSSDCVWDIDENPLGLRTLVEYWNKLSVSCDKLVALHGKLEKEALEKFNKYVFSDFSNKELTENQSLFRATEREKWHQLAGEQLTIKRSKSNFNNIISVDFSIFSKPANEHIKVAASSNVESSNLLDTFYNTISNSFITREETEFEIVKQSDSVVAIFSNSPKQFCINFIDEDGKIISKKMSNSNKPILLSSDDIIKMGTFTQLTIANEL